MSDPLFESAGLSATQLAEVLDLIAGTDISELDVTVNATRLSVRRPPIVAAAPPSEASLTPTEEPRSLAITSPLVGIFRPSVRSGEAVEPGQSIGTIEALGMPTSVDAPQRGTVEDLLVKAGSAVEYGQPLLMLRRAPHAP
jgi:acetyl-CoA carboxylase biotin carboxyl carrier protein